MNRLIRFLFMLFIVMTSLLLTFFFFVWKDLKNVEMKDLPKIETKQEEKRPKIEFNDSVFSLMNKTEEEIVELLGEPARKDQSAYGYIWWVYNDLASYLQVGLLDGRVITVFAAGEDLQSEPIAINDDYKDIINRFDIEHKVYYEDGNSHYAFIMNDQDVQEHPLIKLDEDFFVQLYIDTFTGKVSSLRILTGELLTLQRFYEMEYRGSLPEEKQYSEEEWESIEAGMVEQIYDLTNVFRKRHGLQTVTFNEQVSKVAYDHSKDMYNNHYFSHESKDGRGLKERLEEKDIYYVAAGENIAAQHSDAIAAMQGWMNSKGHRESLLNEQYNSLGIGVYRLYYTQNFIFKH